MLSTHLASSIISTGTNACLLKLSELQIDQQTGQLGSKKSPLIWPSSSIFEYQEDDVDQHKMCPPDTVTRGFRQGPWELFKTQVPQGQPQVASDGPKKLPLPKRNKTGTKTENYARRLRVYFHFQPPQPPQPPHPKTPASNPRAPYGNSHRHWKLREQDQTPGISETPRFNGQLTPPFLICLRFLKITSYQHLP